MSTSIGEQITQNILSTLSTVTVENGYNQTLSVEREKCRGNQPDHNRLVLHEMDPQPTPDAINMKMGWLQPFELDCFVIVPEDQNDTIYPTALLNAIGADVIKALSVDIYRGGLAMDTKDFGWEDYESMDQSGISMRKITFTVHYRHALTDPYELG